MTGGDLQGSHDHGETPQLSRRDFARLTAVAGGVVWGAPKVTSIEFARRAIGTPGGPTTTPPTEPPPTTTTPPSTTSSTTTPESTTTTTVNNQGTTTTTQPGGTTTTVQGGTTTSVPNGTTTTTSDVGPSGTTTPSTGSTPATTVPVSPQSSVPGGPKDPGEGPYNGGNGSGGLLSFTGADSADLAVLGATAIVVGRALYVVGRRPDEEEKEAVEGIISPPNP